VAEAVTPRRRFAGAAAVLLAVSLAGRASGGPAPEVGDFYNVVAPNGADPWVIRHSDGWYYATVTTGVDVRIIRSSTLSGLGGGERKVVWTPPRDRPLSKDLWAPELHPIDGKWYVYFAADDGENANHRMYVLENPSPDPFQGRFVLKGRIFDPADDRWAIDGTVLRVGPRLYFLWSGWEGTKDVRQNLYIAPMRDPWTLAGPRVLISSPTLPWETRGAPPAVNEGPQVLVRGGKVHVVYSASGSWTDHYCLGLLTARADGDLLSPASWVKHPDPVFKSANGVFGPGHCSFVRSPDDTEDWIVYHAARYPGAGWTRLLRAQRFRWDADGRPEFGPPVDPDRPIPVPSGEPRRRRYEAEDATREGAAQVVRGRGASGGSNVGAIDTPESAVTFHVSADQAGPYLVSVRFGNGSAGRAKASHRLTVNGGPPRTVRYENSGRDRWFNAFVPVELNAGANQLRFAKGDHLAELDCIDLIPEPDRRAAGERVTPSP